jgi:hypothetical protein
MAIIGQFMENVKDPRLGPDPGILVNPEVAGNRLSFSFFNGEYSSFASTGSDTLRNTANPLTSDFRKLPGFNHEMEVGVKWL